MGGSRFLLLRMKSTDRFTLYSIPGVTTGRMEELKDPSLTCTNIYLVHCSSTPCSLSASPTLTLLHTLTSRESSQQQNRVNSLFIIIIINYSLSNTCIAISSKT